MRVITTHELSRLTRAQLFALLVQLQAVLADLAEGSPEFQFATETLANVRAVLTRRAPSP